ncbi:MAG: hypothetical protein SFV17_10210 [Candidatus Obscuribacter sp.]|nr:hypothetical protein [Candidatus Obscuribacter sp.]
MNSLMNFLLVLLFSWLVVRHMQAQSREEQNPAEKTDLVERDLQKVGTLAAIGLGFLRGFADMTAALLRAIWKMLHAQETQKHITSVLSSAAAPARLLRDASAEAVVDVYCAPHIDPDEEATEYVEALRKGLADGSASVSEATADKSAQELAKQGNRKRKAGVAKAAGRNVPDSVQRPARPLPRQNAGARRPSLGGRRGNR